MFAFEILMNGKSLDVIGGAECQHAQAMAMLMKYPDESGVIHQQATFSSVTVKTLEDQPIAKPFITLKVGDEITVRVIEVDGFDSTADCGLPPRQPTSGPLRRNLFPN